MYGQNLSDLPDRADAFRDALSDLSEASINAGFEIALRTLKEFPVPSEIREFAIQAAVENRTNLAEEAKRNQRLIEDKIKNDRFENTTMEQRRQEVAEMTARAARKLQMAHAGNSEKPDTGSPQREQTREEYENRMALLRQQADELKGKDEL